MKKLERIFLYSVLALLVFYVFLIDGNVESQVAIQKDIRAKRIVIVNDEGQEVVWLFANKDGNGVIGVCNKDGTVVAGVGASKSGGTMEIYNDEGQKVVLLSADSRTEGGGRVDIFNGDGTSGAFMSASKKGGGIVINNKYGELAILMYANYEDKGMVGVCNRDGKYIGTLP